VNGAQEGGDPLDLVQDHIFLVGLAHEQFAEMLGSGLKSPEGGRLKQIEAKSIGEHCLGPGGLAGSAGPKQEKAFCWCFKKTTYQFHFAPHIGIFDSIIYKKCILSINNAQNIIKNQKKAKKRPKYAKNCPKNAKIGPKTEKKPQKQQKIISA